MVVNSPEAGSMAPFEVPKLTGTANRDEATPKEIVEAAHVKNDSIIKRAPRKLSSYKPEAFAEDCECAISFH